MRNLEKTYLEAKEQYYIGTPIMSDEDFDALENKLKELGSAVINNVGANGLRAKSKHISPMLSLDKIKFYSKDFSEHSKLSEWVKKTNSTKFELTPKYDGNAINVIVNNGKIQKVLSRGNGVEGSDLTDKLKEHLDFSYLEGLYEIRGECVIDVKLFNNKYPGYMNARNFVSGVLGNKDNNLDVIKDLTFNWFEFKKHSNNDFTYTQTEKTFLTKIYTKEELLDKDNFIKIFNFFKDFRENDNFQHDGFVIKVLESDIRKELGETEHHPNWALAIKYPATEITTKINKIEWNLGKTGELIPLAILEPVVLEGATIQKCSAFNFGYVKRNLLSKGAEVSIYKAGDIIPQIDRVITKGETFNYPTFCPSCGQNLKVDDIHLWCDNKDCEEILFQKLLGSITSFGFDFLGSSTIKKLFNKGMREAYEILLINDLEVYLNEKNENFKKIQNQINKRKQIHIKNIITSLGVNDLGGRTAEQIGKKFSNVTYDNKGLQKDILESFEVGNVNYVKLQNIIEKLKNNSIQIEFYEEQVVSNENKITFEMTGSPKDFGYKTKEDFINKVKQMGWEHTNLNKDTDYLVCDDLNSNSSKIQKAKKLGVKIVTYSNLKF